MNRAHACKHPWISNQFLGSRCLCHNLMAQQHTSITRKASELILNGEFGQNLRKNCHIIEVNISYSGWYCSWYWQQQVNSLRQHPDPTKWWRSTQRFPASSTRTHSPMESTAVPVEVWNLNLLISNYSFINSCQECSIISTAHCLCWRQVIIPAWMGHMALPTEAATLPSPKTTTTTKQTNNQRFHPCEC